MEKGKALAPPVPESFGAAAFTAEDAREWQEWQEYSQDYSRYDYEIDEDDEVSPCFIAALRTAQAVVFHLTLQSACNLP